MSSSSLEELAVKDVNVKREFSQSAFIKKTKVCNIFSIFSMLSGLSSETSCEEENIYKCNHTDKVVVIYFSNLFPLEQKLSVNSNSLAHSAGEGAFKVSLLLANVSITS